MLTRLDFAFEGSALNSISKSNLLDRSLRTGQNDSSLLTFQRSASILPACSPSSSFSSCSPGSSAPQHVSASAPSFFQRSNVSTFQRFNVLRTGACEPVTTTPPLRRSDLPTFRRSNDLLFSIPSGPASLSSPPFSSSITSSAPSTPSPSFSSSLWPSPACSCRFDVPTFRPSDVPTIFPNLQTFQP